MIETQPYQNAHFSFCKTDIYKPTRLSSSCFSELSEKQHMVETAKRQRHWALIRQDPRACGHTHCLKSLGEKVQNQNQILPSTEKDSWNVIKYHFNTRTWWRSLTSSTGQQFSLFTRNFLEKVPTSLLVLAFTGDLRHVICYHQLSLSLNTHIIRIWNNVLICFAQDTDKPLRASQWRKKSSL